MTLALPKSCTLTLPKSRQKVSLQVLSSLHALNKDQVCTIYRQFVGENVPSFDEPLNVQDFKAMTVALANLSQVAEGKVIGAGKADSLVEGIAPFETCSPDRKLSKPDKDELVASTPAAFADQEELNSPPVSISALASDNVSTVPGYSALRRLIVNQRLSKSDLEEGDSALDSMLVNQLDCVEQEVCSDTIELQDCWMEWTESGTARPEFLFSLIESGLTALAGLIDLRTVVGRVPPNGSGLTELAAIARVMPTDGKAATAQMVDTILRCLLVAPDDVLPWGILGRAVPSNWLLSHIESIDQWVLRNMRQPIITPNMGRCVVVARATAALGDLRSAHKILGDWLRHSDSIDLRRERTALAERYRQNIVAERYFFDRWTRRSNADVGKGSFALVLPVIDSSNG